MLHWSLQSKFWYSNLKKNAAKVMLNLGSDVYMGLEAQNIPPSVLALPLLEPPLVLGIKPSHLLSVKMLLGILGLNLFFHQWQVRSSKQLSQARYLFKCLLKWLIAQDWFWTPTCRWKKWPKIIKPLKSEDWTPPA